MNEYPQSFPAPFNQLLITDEIVKREITSDNSFNKMSLMLSFGNSYVKNGPTKVNRSFEWYIISAEDEAKSYKVSVTPNLLRCKKNKGEKIIRISITIVNA